MKVIVKAIDGTYEIAKNLSLEEAKKIADKWLGKDCTWVRKNRAISMYGDVLTIEEEE